MKYNEFESVENREKRINDLKEKAGKGKKQTNRIKKSTLAKAAEVKTLITRADLKELGKAKYQNPVISLYLTFTPEKLIHSRKVYLSVFNSLKKTEVRNRKPYIETLIHDQNKILKNDLDELSIYLETFDPENTKSLVIFKSGKELNEVIKLPVGISDLFVIDVHPFITPLVSILQKYKKILLVNVTKAKSIFSTYHLGYVEEIEVLESNAQSETVDRGVPGKAQRHRLTYLQEHFKKTAALSKKYFNDYNCYWVVILGTDDNLISEFSNFMSDDLCTKVIAKILLSPHHTKNDLYKKIEAAIDLYSTNEEKAELANLGSYKAANVLVGGVAEVLEATNRFLLRKIIIDEKLSRPGFICKAHHYLSLNPIMCPYCKSSLLLVENIIDEVIELAVFHKVDLVMVRNKRDQLRGYQGIIGILHST